MRRKSFGKYAVTALALLCMFTSSLVAQQRNRPAATNAPVNNLKIKYKTDVGGQASESTTLIRGSRERSEMQMGGGMEMISITQCDLKRTVQLSTMNKKYMITPMDTGSSAATTVTNARPPAQPVTRGGVVTYTTTSIDTGERRDMFGFKARHVKTTTTMQSSPDACNPINQKIERDGWYIDFSYGLTCEINRSQMMANPYSPGGCQDRYQFKQVGTGRDGYPLIETTTMYGPDGRVVFTSTKEVVELSREPLDPALFEVPAGYTETTNSQELYMPSMGAAMDQAEPSTQSQAANYPAAAPTESEVESTIRVGVMQLNNKSGRSISTDSLQARLIGSLQGSGIDAVALNALTLSDAEAEAKAKRCAFFLVTDITTMKASKLGGMFGRVAGVSGAGKTESKIEFKLFAVNQGGSPRLQSTASAKEEGDEASVGMAIDQEAAMVKSEVMKNNR